MAFRRASEPTQPLVTPRQPLSERGQPEFEPEPITSVRVLLARVVWFIAGPALLLILAFRIGFTRDGWFATTDLLFPLVLVAIVGARWYCFSANDRTDTQGKVVTAEALHRYTRAVVTCGILLWVGANAAGNSSAR